MAYSKLNPLAATDDFYTKEEIDLGVGKDITQLTEEVGAVSEMIVEQALQVETNAGNITNLQNDKADKSDTYTKADVDAKMSSVYVFKGSVKALPDLTNQTIGWVYNLNAVREGHPVGTNWAVIETKQHKKGWDALAGLYDLSIYAEKKDIPTKTSQLENDNKYITLAEIPEVTVPTKTSDLTNDSGYITIESVPTKTSQLTNDSDFTTNAILTQYITALENRISALEELVKQLNTPFSKDFSNDFAVKK